MARLLVIVLFVGMGLGCDPQAKPGGMAHGAPGGGRPGVLSKGQETCRATADCEEAFRCVDGTCRNIDVSRMGEYWWAAGQVAAEKNQLAQSGEYFYKALTTFESDKKEVPAKLLCDYGATLRRKQGDAKASEQAARLLHRCVLQSPPSSSDHWRGLRELAELESAGLEPAVIARDTPAESYLSRNAAAPEVKGVKLDVGRTQPARDKGYEAWAKRLETDQGPRDALLKCLSEYTTKTQKAKLVVVLLLKLRATIGDDDVFLGGTLELAADPGAKGEEAAGATCVRTALASTATDFQKSGSSDSWQGTLTLTLAPE